MHNCKYSLSASLKLETITKIILKKWKFIKNCSLWLSREGLVILARNIFPTIPCIKTLIDYLKAPFWVGIMFTIFSEIFAECSGSRISWNLSPFLFQDFYAKLHPNLRELMFGVKSDYKKSPINPCCFKINSKYIGG